MLTRVGVGALVAAGVTVALVATSDTAPHEAGGRAASAQVTGRSAAGSRYRLTLSRGQCAVRFVVRRPAVPRRGSADHSSLCGPVSLHAFYSEAAMYCDPPRETLVYGQVPRGTSRLVIVAEAGRRAIARIGPPVHGARPFVASLRGVARPPVTAKHGTRTRWRRRVRLLFPAKPCRGYVRGAVGGFTGTVSP